MFGFTSVVEKGRDNCHGYVNIHWYCRKCGHVMNLPQQQGFRFCFHCGRKVHRRVGGEESIAKK